MPEVLPPVDAETVAIAALTAGATGGGGSTPVAGKLPRGFAAGGRAVRITRVGGTPVDHLAYLDRARLQVECYAADAIAAHQLAAGAVVELLGLRDQEVAGGVVTDVRQDLGLRNFPDPLTDAPRYLFGVVLYVHPVGS